MNYVTFDIETYWPPEVPDGGRIDTKIMRASVVGAYYSWLGDTKYLAFLEENVSDFLLSLREADLVVGFNHLWFDLPVLQKYVDWDLKQLNSYDILLEVEKKVGMKVKLDDLAKSNLNTKKTDSYEVYRHYHREGKWAELIDYCLNDVLITERLFAKVLAGEKLLYSDSLRSMEMVLDLPNVSKNSGNTNLNLRQSESIF